MKKINFFLLLSLFITIFGGMTFIERPYTILQEEYGYVVSESKLSKVVLKAKFPNKSFYATEILIEIYDAEKLLYTVKPDTNEGYMPRINLATYDNGKKENIFLGIDSGGSGGYGFFYLYRVDGGKVNTLFDYQKFSDDSVYTADYQNCYKVSVKDNKGHLKFIIDLTLKGKDYLNGLYNLEGQLKKPTAANVGGVNFVFTAFNSVLGYNLLLIYQRIIGLYNADNIGNIVTFMTFENSKQNIMLIRCEI